MSTWNQVSPISTAETQVPSTHTDPPAVSPPTVLGASITSPTSPDPAETTVPTSVMRPLNMTVLLFARTWRRSAFVSQRTVTVGPGIPPDRSAGGEARGLSPHRTDSHRRFENTPGAAEAQGADILHDRAYTDHRRGVAPARVAGPGGRAADDLSRGRPCGGQRHRGP